MALTFQDFQQFSDHLDAIGLDIYRPSQQLQWALHTDKDAEGNRTVDLCHVNTNGITYSGLITFHFLPNHVEIYPSEHVDQGVTYSLDDIFLFGTELKRDTWHRYFVEMQSVQLEFLRDVLGPYHTKLTKERGMPAKQFPVRHEYLTFGDFVNFCYAVRHKRNGYGIYTPFQKSSRALHIYDTMTQCSLVILDETHLLPIPRLTFVFLTGGDVQICRVVDGATQYDGVLTYKADDPFCFGTDEHPVDWYIKAELSGSDYEFFRDMLGKYRGGCRVV